MTYRDLELKRCDLEISRALIEISEQDTIGCYVYLADWQQEKRIIEQQEDVPSARDYRMPGDEAVRIAGCFSTTED